MHEINPIEHYDRVSGDLDGAHDEPTLRPAGEGPQVTAQEGGDTAEPYHVPAGSDVATEPENVTSSVPEAPDPKVVYGALAGEFLINAGLPADDEDFRGILAGYLSGGLEGTLQVKVGDPAFAGTNPVGTFFSDIEDRLRDGTLFSDFADKLQERGLTDYGLLRKLRNAKPQSDQ